MRYRVKLNGIVVFTANRQHYAAFIVDKLCQIIIIPATVELVDAESERPYINRWEYLAPFQWRCR